MNEELCKALFKMLFPNKCWHEDIHTIDDDRVCICGKCDEQVESEFEEYANPNLLELVSIVCECGGSGKAKKYEPCCQHLAPCPNHTEPRLITRLQQEMERQGLWEEFKRWLGMSHENIVGGYWEVGDILTDINKLAASALEFLKGRE